MLWDKIRVMPRETHIRCTTTVRTSFTMCQNMRHLASLWQQYTWRLFRVYHAFPPPLFVCNTPSAVRRAPSSHASCSARQTFRIPQVRAVSVRTAIEPTSYLPRKAQEIDMRNESTAYRDLVCFGRGKAPASLKMPLSGNIFGGIRCVLNRFGHGRDHDTTTELPTRFLFCCFWVACMCMMTLRDNWCGATPQVNEWCDDWIDFFAKHRLQKQASMIVQSHKDKQLAARVDELCSVMRERYVEFCLHVVL